MSLIIFIVFLWTFLYFGYGWKKYKHKDYLWLSLWAALAVLVKIYAYLVNNIFHFSEDVISIVNTFIRIWWPIFLVVWLFLLKKMKDADKARSKNTPTPDGKK